MTAGIRKSPSGPNYNPLANYIRFGISTDVALAADALVPVPWDVIEASQGDEFAEISDGLPTLRFTQAGFYLVTVFLLADNTVIQPLVGVVFTAPENDLNAPTTQGGNQNPNSAELSTSATIIVTDEDIVGAARKHFGVIAVGQVAPNELRPGTNITVIRLGEV